MNSKLKKIVLYIDFMAHGGAQRVMSNLAGYFVDQGIDVLLVNDFHLQDDENQYSVDKRVRRLFLQQKNTGNMILKNIKRVSSLRRIIKQENPDVVLSFLGRPNKRMLIATIGLPTKKIVSVRNDPNKEYGASWIKKKIVNIVFRLADGIIFQTKDAQKYFSLGIQEKSIIIYNPVADVFFNTSHVGDRKTIVSIGRLEPQKNNVLLINAFASIADKYPEYNLVFYGEGSLKGELEKKVASFDLSSRIKFAGDTDNVPDVLCHSSIFVLSSDYEGMPNALMEAMAVGVPCISTDCPCGGPKELMPDEYKSFLVPVNEVSEMASRIERLLSDDSGRIKYGDFLKYKATRFENKIILLKWYNYLEDILGKITL